MKLSTSGYARGIAAFWAALAIMAFLVAAQVDPTVICIAGIAAWIAVAWLLSALKNKEVAPSFRSSLPSIRSTNTQADQTFLRSVGDSPTKKCPFCAETVLSEAIICRFCGNDTRIPVPPSSTSMQSRLDGAIPEIDRQLNELPLPQQQSLETTPSAPLQATVPTLNAPATMDPPSPLSKTSTPWLLIALILIAVLLFSCLSTLTLWYLYTFGDRLFLIAFPRLSAGM